MGKKQAEIAQTNDDETQIIAARLAILKEKGKWDMPMAKGKALTGVALQNWLSKKEEDATRSAVERGLGYGLLKRELGHGAFEGWLKDNSIAPRTAQQAMKTAQLLMAISDSNTQRVADISQRKLNVLARLPAPVVDDMFDNGDLESINDASYDQLQEIVQLRKQLDKTQTKNDRLSVKVGEQAETIKQRNALPETALYIKELRRAVLEEIEALRVNAHQVQAILDKLKMLPDDTERSDFDSIAHPLMYGLQGLHASVTQLSVNAYRYLTDFKPDVDVFYPDMDKAELKRSEWIRDQFIDASHLRQKLREVDTAPAQKSKVKKKAAK